MAAATSMMTLEALRTEENNKTHTQVRLLLGAVLLKALDDLVDVVTRAEKDGRSLVDVLRHNVKDGHVAGGGDAARLLNDERHRVALVQQSQLKYTYMYYTEHTTRHTDT